MKPNIGPKIPTVWMQAGKRSGKEKISIEQFEIWP